MNVGTDEITSLMVGGMGVKTIAAGSEILYERGGGCVYILLETKKEST